MLNPDHLYLALQHMSSRDLARWLDDAPRSQLQAVVTELLPAQARHARQLMGERFQAHQPMRFMLGARQEPVPRVLQWLYKAIGLECMRHAPNIAPIEGDRTTRATIDEWREGECNAINRVGCE